MDQVRKFTEPIKTKWVYHFIVSPKTNLIDKPEWYLNQTLKWIHIHIDTVEKNVKLKNEETQVFNVKQMFILCMIELVRMRLDGDMSKIVDSLRRQDVGSHVNSEMNAILIHTYNEVIQFVKVASQLLGDSYKYIDDKHDVLAVFYNETTFETVMGVERSCAKKNLYEITHSSTCWDPVLEGGFVDIYKIPRCVDEFMLLIRAITDRMECFREQECQFQLIELQFGLFRKLLKFMNDSTDSTPVGRNILSNILLFEDQSTIDLTRILRVLNGVDYVRLILKDKYFIPERLLQKLHPSLFEMGKKLTQDYKSSVDWLIDRVISISECADCDVKQFCLFIKPKLSEQLYETVKEELHRLEQARRTRSLLGELSSGRE